MRSGIGVSPALAVRGFPGPGAAGAGPTGHSPNLRCLPSAPFHRRPPKLATSRTGFNEKAADRIAKVVGSMWMFYASVIGFTLWMAGIGVTLAGDHYPFNLMLLAVGGIMQWLAMIAILVAQNAQGVVQDKQVEHLHDLGMATHRSVLENTAVTEALREQLRAGPEG